MALDEVHIGARPDPSGSPPVEITVVMPVMNSMRYLGRVIPALLSAGRHRGHVEFVFVDNGSRDGSREYLSEPPATDVSVFVREHVSISALRNFGAAHARGPLLSFLDADCEIGPSYFDEAIADLRESGAAATGHAYDLPALPGWIESSWHALHFLGRAGDVGYLNAGNFFISHAAFTRAGGFREDLWTGEDAELGQRLRAAGQRIHANPRVRAVHLGNPQSVRHFYRRAVWHGVGMFGTVGLSRLDRPTVMMFAHLIMSVAGVLVLATQIVGSATGLAAAVALQLLVPAVTVAYRARRAGGAPLLARVRGAFLYWVYYWARLHALALIVTGRASRYRK